MNEKEKQTSLELFSKFKSQVNLHSAARIAKKIGDMNKGALVKVWGKIGDLWAMIMDNDVPWHNKTIALAALIYVITPIDAIPDLIPALGLSDDVTVVLAAVASLGAALARYSNKADLLDKVAANINPQQKPDWVFDQIKAMVSVLSLTAASDQDISEDEEIRALQLIDYFVFSEEGYCSSSFLKKNKIRKKEVKGIIQESFDHPLSLDEIAKIVEKMESEETTYYYAYSIAKTDNDINPMEREFLDQLAIALDIQLLDKNQIERQFNQEWLDGFEPSLE